MSMLKLKSAGKDYLWGGTRLLTEYEKEFTGSPMAESWELSCHPDGLSTVTNGTFKGKTLAEYMKIAGKEVWGTNCQRFLEFPILIKFIDAKMDLSVQVHPCNEYALKHENQYGKTEMWHVVDCEPGAYIYYGLKEKVSREEFAKRIQENTLIEILQKVLLKPGDTFFIAAGTIHAIGAGALIAEIQQNSNVTYRVYDFGRKGVDGKPRELHVEKALDVTDLIPPLKHQVVPPHIASCDYFTVDKVSLDSQEAKSIEGNVTEKSFLSILVLSGEGKLCNAGEELAFKKGDSFFLPAGAGTYTLSGTGNFLLTCVEEKKDGIWLDIVMNEKSGNIQLRDDKGEILGKTLCECKSEDIEAVVQSMSEKANQLLESMNYSMDACMGANIFVKDSFGIERSKNSLKGLFEKMLKIPVYITKD